MKRERSCARKDFSHLAATDDTDGRDTDGLSAPQTFDAPSLLVAL
jgi:hypothetical protein